jgi:hypothetical protein
METILREDVDMVYSGRRYVNHTMRTDLPSGDFEAQPYDFESIVKANYIDTSDILHTKGGAYIIGTSCGAGVSAVSPLLQMRTLPRSTTGTATTSNSLAPCARLPSRLPSAT